MPRKFLPVGALACWTLIAGACSDEAKIIDEGAGGARAGSGGRSGSTGVAGRAGAGGSMAGSGGSAAGDTGLGGDAGSGAGDGGSAGAGGSDVTPDAGPDSGAADCTVNTDCVDDGNPCTTHTCTSQVCVTGNAAASVTCGSAVDDACTNPDTCNGAGACIPNHATDGLVCDANTDLEDDGHCIVGVCDCASERVTATENYQWQTGSTDPDLVDLSCDGDCTGIPDHVVVFTATLAGTYRFFAAASEGGESFDTALAVMAGNCSPAPTVELGCNDDIVGADALIADSELDVPLTAGQVVSVVITTPCENAGADGVLRIELLPPL